MKTFNEHLKVLSGQMATTSSDSVRNNSVISIRIMNYSLPDNGINKFCWDHFTIG